MHQTALIHTYSLKLNSPSPQLKSQPQPFYFTVNFTHHNTYPPTLKFYGKSARKNIFMHYRSHPPSSMKTSCFINERNRIAEHQMKLIVRLNFKNLNLHLHSMVILTLLSTNLKTSIIGTISTMITTKKTVTITFI